MVITQGILLIIIFMNSFVLPSHAHCNMYGLCGPKDNGWFSRDLNCYNLTHSVLLNETEKAQLTFVCGASFNYTSVCCNNAQLQTLNSNLATIYNLASACPACWANLQRFWCEFTCGPTQTDYINITATAVSPVTNLTVVTGLDLWITESYGEGVFESCRNVKFPQDNSFLMDFIGGGASNYLEMFNYMGEERFAGSPFAISFPNISQYDPMNYMPLNVSAIPCNSENPQYRCSCVDCPDCCPTTEDPVTSADECYVEGMPCVLFSTIIIYIAFLLGFLYTMRAPDMYEVVPQHEQSPSIIEPKFTINTHFVQRWSRKCCYQLGLYCSKHPLTVIIVSIVILSVFSVGWYRFDVETEPVNLWVGPNSETALQKDFFDSHFGPFYRIQQIILSREDASIINYNDIEQVFLLQQHLKILISSKGDTLSKFCFQVSDGHCVIQSIAGYYNNKLGNFLPATWKSKFDQCTASPSLCLPPSKQPLKPPFVLGGYEGNNFSTAKALIITYVFKNWKDPSYIAAVSAWENAFIQFMESLPQKSNFNISHLNISFSSESSIEVELNRQTADEIPIVIASYLVMFLYASIALGRYSRKNEILEQSTNQLDQDSLPSEVSLTQEEIPSRHCVSWMINSRFLLSLSGIIIAISSVIAAVGIFSFIGIKATLIIAEVIPFLVLAVGVDNIFIITKAFDKICSQSKTEVRSSDNGEGMEATCLELQIAQTLAEVGPGIIFATCTETLAFSLGGLVEMPAVSSFSLYAALSIFIDSILQMTCFVSLLTLDAKRIESNRLDCFPCISIPVMNHGNEKSWMIRLFENWYAPILLKKYSQMAIGIIFSLVFFIAINLCSQVQLGLDQRIALPRNSYLISYFNDLDHYFEVGPPVFFVVENVNATQLSGQQTLCGRFTTCNELSLGNILEAERKVSTLSYIAEPASIWLDDFMLWLDPAASLCCRIDSNNNLCQPTSHRPSCETCLQNASIPWTINMTGFPEGPRFVQYLNLWLDSIPSSNCPLGGSSGYSSAIVINTTDDMVETSWIRTYHTPLKTQKDFISAYQSALDISHRASEANNITVFPYSPFYVFFEQYSSIVSVSYILLTCGVLGVSALAYLFLGSLRISLIFLTVVVMIVVDLVGFVMGGTGVTLNAISLVNLLMSVGISCEFCCHIIKKFKVENYGSRKERVNRALVDIGASILSGITLTKFAGVLVLSFSTSKIFELYYFRMFFGLIFISAFHGLMLLPLLLLWFGGDDVISVGDHQELLGWNEASEDWVRGEEVPQTADPSFHSTAFSPSHGPTLDKDTAVSATVPVSSEMSHS